MLISLLYRHWTHPMEKYLQRGYPSSFGRSSYTSTRECLRPQTKQEIVNSMEILILVLFLCYNAHANMEIIRQMPVCSFKFYIVFTYTYASMHSTLRTPYVKPFGSNKAQRVVEKKRVVIGKDLICYDCSAYMVAIVACKSKR